MSDYKIYIDFTKAREGTTSKDPHDSASKDPCPGTGGIHTNKGITWTTFKQLAVRGKYTPTMYNFVMMSDDIFDRIFKIFWDDSGAGKIDNQAIANLLMQVQWGSGNTVIFIKKIQQFLGLATDGKAGTNTINAINNYPDKRALYEHAHQKRLEFLRGIAAYKDFGKGWEARMQKLYKFNQQFL